MTKVKYKSYNQNDFLLLPPSLEELIPATHPVRIVSHVMDHLDITKIEKSYKGGGTSSYNPRMMLKVLVYAYMNNVYSGRKIETLLFENINFMWLSGYSRPDFRTINLFRSQRLCGHFHDLFTQVIELIHHEGLVSLDVQYIDGTKIESVANKYTFVWRKSVEHRDQNLKNKVDAILKQAEEVIASEEESVGTTTGIDATDLSDRLKRITEKIDKLPKELQKEIKSVKSESFPKLEEYTHNKEVLGERESYSKTDHGATFMRMKEDYMGNGQLKPGYNVQIATENQFITNYDIFQRPGDTATLISFLDSFEKRYGKQSSEIVADSGYGSEQNYQYMLDKGMLPYVKYNYFHMDIRSERKRPSDAYKLKEPHYIPKEDCFICPMGQRMTFCGTKEIKSELGHVSQVRLYKAQNCSRCNIKGVCTKAKGDRIMQVNIKLMMYKKIVRCLLTSERGLMHRSNRPIEPEAVFGQIKKCCGFKRFSLKTKPKVKLEFGLIALAHNMRKFARKVNQTGNKPSFLDSKSTYFSQCIRLICFERKILIAA